MFLPFWSKKYPASLWFLVHSLYEHYRNPWNVSGGPPPLHSHWLLHESTNSWRHLWWRHWTPRPNNYIPNLVKQIHVISHIMTCVRTQSRDYTKLICDVIAVNKRSPDVNVTISFELLIQRRKLKGNKYWHLLSGNPNKIEWTRHTSYFCLLQNGMPMVLTVCIFINSVLFEEFPTSSNKCACAQPVARRRPELLNRFGRHTKAADEILPAPCNKQVEGRSCEPLSKIKRLFYEKSKILKRLPSFFNISQSVCVTWHIRTAMTS